MNTVNTYFGGPLHSDLVVDGIVYNYIVSNHHGDQTPNITDGFDRTFGPGYYHFNKGQPGASLQSLREEALQYANSSWNTDFYDSIAPHIPNYIPTSNRGTWHGKITLPPHAQNPIAILSQNNIDVQDNVLDPTAYQYWSEIPPNTNSVEISHVKAGTYRLTLYASGIFGEYTQDDILIAPGKTTTTRTHWREDSAGTELWRIGIPDKSSQEFRHGAQHDPTHPLHPEEFRIYWAAYDFVQDFPTGVEFTVGTSVEARDWNYIHWSVFGGAGNAVRPEGYVGQGEVNNWTIRFDLSEREIVGRRRATLTVQLSGAKTAAGNTDVFNATQRYSDLPYTVVVNGRELEPRIIPYYQSSSCGVRSAVICYNLALKFVFDGGLLKVGGNEMVLSLPFNATDYESALLPTSVYVQYDALRLEAE